MGTPVDDISTGAGKVDTSAAGIVDVVGIGA